MPHNLDGGVQPLAKRTGDAGWDVAGRAPWPMRRMWREWTRPRIAVHDQWWLPSGITIVHLFLTAVMVSFAVTFLDTKDTFATGYAYRFFVQVWPHTEHRWGLVFLVPSGAGVLGLFVPRTWWRSRLALASGLGLSHVLCALSFWTSNPIGEFWQFMALCAALGIWRILAEGSIKWPAL